MISGSGNDDFLRVALTSSCCYLPKVTALVVLVGAYQAGSEPSLKSTNLGFCGWERTLALERPPVPFLRKGLGCFLPDYAI